MSKQTLNLGTAPAGADGDTVRGAFVKLEANMVELYGQLGASGSPLALPAALPVTKGGTGGTTQATALAGLGLTGAFLKSNILGTVSQASGVPTGAIIEKGSNSNGQYVKFADGTLICMVGVGTNSSGTYAVGALYGSDAYPMTWPVAFASKPYVSPGLDGGANSNCRFPCCYSPWTATSAGSWRAMSTENTAVATTIYVIGIGRWF